MGVILGTSILIPNQHNYVLVVFIGWYCKRKSAAMAATHTTAVHYSKPVLLGDVGAGKSSLVLRFVKKAIC
ncbi:hypothetical protein CASFOL_022377 [Castilleja foliolosa]|uniref:Uncharacterized protein n=1 Tax=Castilleja foliolosa TaxID=1961234 RepID=A0ABD3CUD6_9LAMI